MNKDNIRYAISYESDTDNGYIFVAKKRLATFYRYRPYEYKNNQRPYPKKVKDNDGHIWIIHREGNEKWMAVDLNQ